MLRTLAGAAAAVLVTAVEKGAFLEGNSRRYDLSSAPSFQDSILRGRRVIWLGSSLSCGRKADGSTAASWLEAMSGCVIAADLSAEGSRLCTDVHNSGIARLRALASSVREADILIVELGDADVSPLGRITEGFDRFACDTKTVLGAAEYIISFAREMFRCDVCFFTPYAKNNPSLRLLIEKMRTVKDKWECGLLDLGTLDPQALSPGERKLYFAGKNDLTRAGYRDWLMPEIYRQLCDTYGGNDEKI